MGEVVNSIKLAEKAMGRKIQNECGSCFDAVAHGFIEFINRPECEDVRVVHGIGIANWPGQEGLQTAHAWIEFTLNKIRAAHDVIWLVSTNADHYRKNLNLKYYIEYGHRKFDRIWKQKGYPGPWDLKIKEVADRVNFT